MTTKSEVLNAVEILATFNAKANAEETAEAICKLYPEIAKLNASENGSSFYSWHPGQARLICTDGDILIKRDQFNAGSQWDKSRDMKFYTRAFEC